MRVLRIAVLFVIVAACGGGGGHGVSTGTTTTTSAPVIAVTTTLPRLHFKQPEEATAHLVNEWQAGDKDAAAQAASADAVTAVFAKPWMHMPFNGCQQPLSPEAPVDCSYSYNKGLLNMHLTKTNGDWTVVSVLFAS